MNVKCALRLNKQSGQYVMRLTGAHWRVGSSTAPSASPRGRRPSGRSAAKARVRGDIGGDAPGCFGDRSQGSIGANGQGSLPADLALTEIGRMDVTVAQSSFFFGRLVCDLR